MIEITTRAEDFLLQLRGQRGHDRTDGVRFETEAGRLRLTFVPASKPRDRVLVGARLPIFIAPDLAEMFPEARIDAEVSDGTSRLVLRRNRPSTEGTASQL